MCNGQSILPIVTWESTSDDGNDPKLALTYSQQGINMVADPRGQWVKVSKYRYQKLHELEAVKSGVSNMWEYVKGSEADFEGAPDWCTHVSMSAVNKAKAWEVSSQTINGNLYQWCEGKRSRKYENCNVENLNIIAQRRKVDNLQSRVNDANLGDALKEMFKDTAPVDNKYNRQCKGVTIDVYDVLLAFNVTNPALQHLVKKALCTGLRGHKDKSQDLQDILDSAKRAVELERNK